MGLEHLAIAASGDLAYTAGLERSHVSVDGGPRRDMTLRVTHLYRRTGGAWKLLHRHADLPRPIRARPPPDGRPARALGDDGPAGGAGYPATSRPADRDRARQGEAHEQRRHRSLCPTG